jgi:rfaE bifunctional protein kinase chain/domain
MAALLSKTRLVELLKSFRGLRVGVIGDFTLDGYWYADMTRSVLSRETPLFPRPVVRETYSCGGAANVAWNLADLGAARVFALTVLGQDWRGDLLRRVLAEARINLDLTLTWPEWSTPFYGKVVLTGPGTRQEDARLDFINTHALPPEAQTALLAQVETCLPELDALVIADYQSFGMATPMVVAALNNLAKKYPRVVFLVDSRDQVSAFQGMVLKPNDIEAGRWLFSERRPDEVSQVDLAQAGVRQQAGLGHPLYITLGEKGCLAFFNGETWLLPAVAVKPPIDTVGAGDTFLGALACALAAGAAPWEAGLFANLSTGVTIKKLGVTGTASPEEILALADSSGLVSAL